MSQDLHERLHLAEQSARRWKVLALGSWALLALLFLVCIGLAMSQVNAMRAMAEQQALRAQQAQEEAARLRQEQAKALEQAERHLYASQILLAQNEQPAAPPGQAFLVVAYLPDYRVETLDPDAAALVTDLIFFSIEPKPTGELNRERLTDKALEKLADMRKRHKTRLLVAIGGWGRSKAFARVAADPQRRSRFARSLVRFCADNGFDGADFDWEHPANDAENADYARLLSEVKEAFRPKRLLVTVALADWQNPGAAAYEAVDRIHIMAYDHEGERHSTFEQAVADVKAFEARKVPRAKLCLGLPFYGRGIKDRKVQMSYADVVRQYRPGPEADSAGGVYFNGIGTIRRKTLFAKEHGLGGIMVWELGQDASGKASLLRAIQQDASGKASLLRAIQEASKGR